jgi:replicative DNA helicase
MIEFKKYIHYDTDIEAAVLGVCLMERFAFARIIGLEAEHFYHNGNKVIFKVIKAMFEAAAPIDILTVRNWLISKENTPTIDNWDTGYYLMRLTNNVCGSGHLEYHCHLLKEMWRKREMIGVKFESKDGANIDPYEEAERMRQEISRILSGDNTKEWVSMDEMMYNLIIHQKQMASGEFKYITTGFPKLDYSNGGFTGGDLIIIAARPSVGKSALLACMALRMAAKGETVGIVTLEMSNLQISARLAAIHTDYTFRNVYADLAKDEEQHAEFYNKVSKSTINLPIFFSDKTNVNINDIRAKAMQLKHKHGLNVLFIDYLQLMESVAGNKNYNREQEVSKMSRGLKVLAKELDIPVVCLAQINRDVEKRTGNNRYPKLSDLRESGSIEQDADVVVFLHSDYKSGYEVDENGISTYGQADLLVRKWRNGVTCHLQLNFDPEKMKFTEKNIDDFDSDSSEQFGYKPVKTQITF